MISLILQLLFWSSAGLVAYVYLGYPALAALLATQPRRVHREAGYTPSVSILIPAHNEADVIAATLKNKLALHYPAEHLEILVVSDESDDGTDAIVHQLAADSAIPIRLHRQSPRYGKTAGINTLACIANAEILAFADANSLWASDALNQLIANFADPTVGYVTGKMVYTHDDGSLVGDGCSAYMRYENWLRARETDLGSIAGVDGGIDAMRRTLYSPLRPEQLPDFVQPLKVVEQGYRVVYDPRALLKEPALGDGASEFSMRVRVTLRALWALKDMAHLLNPLRAPRFAWQLISHKLLRYLAFVPLTLLALSSLALAPVHGFYALAACAQLVFYTAGFAGLRAARPGRLPLLLVVPYYFTLLNVACLRATLAFCQGERRVTWTPRRG